MREAIKINKIQTNNGQIDGLPKNPRFIRDERFEKLKKSIADFPEMLDLREIVVFPQAGKFVCIGGNMRLRACRDLGYKEIPVKVLPEDFAVEKLAEFVIKDNVSFGSDDFDLLANEWTDFDLEDWGLNIPVFMDGDEITDEFSLKDGDRAPFQQMTFTLADEQAQTIRQAIKDAQADGYKYEPMFGNENSNGNALYSQRRTKEFNLPDITVFGNRKTWRGDV